MSKPNKHFYQFENFCVNREKCILFLAGEEVKLVPKAVEVLVVLLERQGEIVEKEIFFSEVWPDRFVDENYLSTYISLIRKSLGNYRNFIETVQGRGYRFASDITVKTSAEGEEFSTEQSTASLSAPPLVTDDGNDSNRAFSDLPETASPIQSTVVASESFSSKIAAPFAGHFQFVLIGAFLYAGQYAASILLEASMEFKSLGAKALIAAIQIVPWIFLTSVAGFWIDWRWTVGKRKNGELLSIFVFVGGAFVVFCWLFGVLPSFPVTKATFPTYTGLTAHLKNTIYSLAVGVTYLILPFHFVVAMQKSLSEGQSDREQGLLFDKRWGIAPLNAIYIKPGVLSSLLILAGALAFPLMHYLISNIQENENRELFIYLYYTRIGLWFIVGLAGLFWYKKILEELKAECVPQLRPVKESEERLPKGEHWWRRPVVWTTSIALLGAVAIATYLLINNRSSGSREEIIVNGAKTIAILPFKPLSAESHDESFDLGMADALITKLINIKQVVVRPISAVRKYNKPDQDPVAAGRELRVESVLDGSIQKIGERIRVTVRLISVRDGTTLWTEKFDEKFSDIFLVQDIISEKVAAALSFMLTKEEKKELSKTYTKNTQAYQFYLKGRFFWNKRTPDDLKKAIEYFELAIKSDANYALAYAGLADCYIPLGSFGNGVIPPEKAMPAAREAAVKALEIDDTLAEAHVSLALVKDLYDWNWKGAEKEYRRAIELNPNYQTARHWYADYLAMQGRLNESITEIKRAQEIDPVSLIISAHVGWILYFARQYDQAIKELQKTLEMEPNYYTAHAFLGMNYKQKSRYEEAIVEFQKALDIFPDSPAVLAELGFTYAQFNKRDKAIEVLGKLESLDKQGYVSPYYIAVVYTGLGERDHAFKWLDEAYKRRAPELASSKVDPNLDKLRQDARFTDLLKRVGHTP